MVRLLRKRHSVPEDINNRFNPTMVRLLHSLTNIVGSDSLQEATIQVQVMNDAEGNIHVYWDFKLHSTTIGTIELSGKITPTPTQQTQQTHTQIQTQAQQTSKGEFEASIAVFKRLGYDIPQSYIGRMSWYFYNLANRVIRDRKHNDPEFVQWVKQQSHHCGIETP